jgi:isoquinoline 1-oxidoreductase alpha subunit
MRHRPVRACTVHLDGRPARSCVLPVGLVKGRAVTTIEAIGQTQAGQKVQEAWLDLEVVQCGYCQSGQIMAAVALLTRNPHPDDAAILIVALSHPDCRATPCRWRWRFTPRPRFPLGRMA